MNKAHIFLVSLLFACGNSNQKTANVAPQTQQTYLPLAKVEKVVPLEIECLMSVYPDQIIGFENNYIVFTDRSKMIFDDGKEKSTEELINNPDVKDMFAYSYPKGKIDEPAKFQDAGRIRNDDFFKKIYGSTSAEVQQNLTTIVWCPKLVGQKLQISKINDVDKLLAAVSAELDEHPEWKDYLHSAGTFNWRTIRGTNNRLSAHSFGIAIDLNTKYSNYWQWDCKCTTENVDLTYKNKIPQEIIDIFEKYDFIWGDRKSVV